MKPPGEAPAQDDPTPTDAPPRPQQPEHQLPTRPHLVRSPPARLSELPATSDGEASPATVTTKGNDDGSADSQDASTPRTTGRGKPEMERLPSGTEDKEEKLARLREAVNAKLMMQSRKRGSYGPTAQKRVSPIGEESASQSQMSPSLTAAFASPEVLQRPLSTISTESTQSTESTESNRTVRASVPATPAEGRPLRTPSYPFPYVPGTPCTWSTSFHQPFTNLSPTVSNMPSGDQDTPRRSSAGLASGGSTPAATTTDFMPPGQGIETPEDPRYPTPNLYDLVLALNAEPGLESWWTAVTSMMEESYGAERVTLVMPLDPTDMENVPWGQKATFSAKGREELHPPRTGAEPVPQGYRPDIVFREASAESARDFQMQKLHPERLRPRLESRHSYAGPPAREAQSITSEPSAKPVRPAGPQRTVTHAPGMLGGIGPGRQPPQRFPSTSSFRQSSLATDADFSSIGIEADSGPYAEVFPNLRALDHERRPLIEPGGVNRVLERGRVVTITRDYALDDVQPPYGTASTVPGGDAQPGRAIKPTNAEKLFGNYRSTFAADNAFNVRRDYEEYEQFPASPWAQSPAPSPAIQADEETNPFFATDQQGIEEAFSPGANTPKDYNEFIQVEAIGVERASTVIHIPLVHPTLSKPMQSLRMRYSKDHSGPPQRSNTLDLERKAPMAVLSVLSATVPYPPNLTSSLKLFAPHLATSLYIQQQVPINNIQPETLRHRRTASGHLAADAPMRIEPTSLEDIVHAELEEAPGSLSGSMTSPSDYSGRSKHSPSSSIVGTPGWDPATHGWTSKSVAGTPGLTGTEIVDNYFEAKRRTGVRSGSNSSASAHVTPAKTSNKPSPQDSKAGPGKEDKTPLSEQRLKPSKSLQEDRSPLRRIQEREESPTRQPEGNPASRPAMRHTMSHSSQLEHHAANAARHHSLLHSYGADFESSFGALSGGVSLESTTPEITGHARKSSYPEEMPPPSERLLRTIIDAVPVQIFTANADTGQLSWVNAKYLIYRGQSPRQVLDDPWGSIHPDDRPDFVASWHRSLRTAQQLQQKVRLQRFDGDFRWFYVRLAPLKNPRQRIVHWIGTMMDFHEQHLAELNAARQQETAASEAKYRALANSRYVCCSAFGNQILTLSQPTNSLRRQPNQGCHILQLAMA
jgi:PAS domain S-box-containing protein